MTQPKVDAVLIDEETLDLQELASACAVPPTWVVERVEAGLLACSSSAGEMRFASAHLVRARRVGLRIQPRFVHRHRSRRKRQSGAIVTDERVVDAEVKRFAR
jgi:hypothetical protein